MLRNMSDLEGRAVNARDGVIGRVTDFYFDDEAWAVRYLIVETGNWLSNRRVLISPIAIVRPIEMASELSVSMTREQVKNSPDIDTDKPVSRQHEREYLSYYSYYPFYWAGSGLWGSSNYPGAMLTGVGNSGSGADYLTASIDRTRELDDSNQHQDDDPHLRSGNAVTRYRVDASDGGIGHVEGLLLDDETWAIRYIVVNTSNWWLGHLVLIAPQWLESVSWAERTVSVTMTREEVKTAPKYDPSTLPDRNSEADLYRHHKHTGYWADEVRLENPQFRVIGNAHEIASRISNGNLSR